MWCSFVLTYFTLDLINLYIFHTITFEQLVDIEKKFYEALHTYWYEQNYLTPKWWLLVSLSVIPPILWWIIVSKKRIIEITTYGLFYGLAAIILDSIGSNALVWAYPVRLTPYLHPQLYPYDIGVVIIPFMLIYQKWSNNFKKFLIYTALLSLYLSFIGEPFMEWLGIYQEITWKNMYSFPIYWLLSIICWCIIQYFKKLEKNH